MPHAMEDNRQAVEGGHRPPGKLPQRIETTIGRTQARQQKSVSGSNGKRGFLSELSVFRELVLRGYEITGAIMPGGRTDCWIRSGNSKITKLQIKTGRRNSHSPTKYRISLSTHGRSANAGTYDADEVDFFIGVEPGQFRDHIYIIPYADAYPNGKKRQGITLMQEHYGAWHLLPKPYKKGWY